MMVATKQVQNQTGFSTAELQLGYTDFHKLAVSRKDSMLPEIREWLAAFDRWDFACSPMSDRDRAKIRYGHYIGWFAKAGF